MGGLGTRAPGGFQYAPLIEVVKGERIQVGFSLTLYVAAPMENAPARSGVTRWGSCGTS